jgi:hypothetical protein
MPNFPCITAILPSLLPQGRHQPWQDHREWRVLRASVSHPAWLPQINDTPKPVYLHDFPCNINVFPVPADDPGKVTAFCLIDNTICSNERHGGPHGGGLRRKICFLPMYISKIPPAFTFFVPAILNMAASGVYGNYYYGGGTVPYPLITTRV